MGRIGGHVTWVMDYVHGVNSLEKDVKGVLELDRPWKVGKRWEWSEWRRFGHVKMGQGFNLIMFILFVFFLFYCFQFLSHICEQLMMS